MHVVRTSWILNKSTYKSGIKVWNEENQELEFFDIKKGDKLSWTIRGPRNCIGRRLSETEFVQCPTGQVIAKSTIKCESCSGFDYFDPCIRCNGYSCQASAERYNICKMTPYVVYAAVFNDGLLKVGISTERRVLTRWVEQGADYAGILATITNGMKARQIETELGKLPGVTTSVSGLRKQAMLLEHLSLKNAEEIVQPLVAKQESFHSKVELKDLSSYYGFSSLNAEPHKWRERSQPLSGLQIAGDVVGMKGSLLVTKINGAYYVMNLKSIIGYRIDNVSEVQIVTQSGLEDFI